MDTVAAKRKAVIVEKEWKRWLASPAVIPTRVLIRSWLKLLEEVLGREPQVIPEDK